jgi:Mn-dependent DtxR family transcriptional regulator
MFLILLVWFHDLIGLFLFWALDLTKTGARNQAMVIAHVACIAALVADNARLCSVLKCDTPSVTEAATVLNSNSLCIPEA